MSKFVRLAEWEWLGKFYAWQIVVGEDGHFTVTCGEEQMLRRKSPSFASLKRACQLREEELAQHRVEQMVPSEPQIRPCEMMANGWFSIGDTVVNLAAVQAIVFGRLSSTRRPYVELVLEDRTLAFDMTIEQANALGALTVGKKFYDE